MVPSFNATSGAAVGPYRKSRLNHIAICPEGAGSGPKVLLHWARDTVSI